MGWVDNSRDHCALKIKNRGGQPLSSAHAFSGHQRNKVKIKKLLLFPVALKIGCPSSLTFWKAFQHGWMYKSALQRSRVPQRATQGLLLLWNSLPRTPRWDKKFPVSKISMKIWLFEAEVESTLGVEAGSGLHFPHLTKLTTLHRAYANVMTVQYSIAGGNKRIKRWSSLLCCIRICGIFLWLF